VDRGKKAMKNGEVWGENRLKMVPIWDQNGAKRGRFTVILL
jgi:hypothetical protein